MKVLAALLTALPASCVTFSDFTIAGVPCTPAPFIAKRVDLLPTPAINPYRDPGVCVRAKIQEISK